MPLCRQCGGQDTAGARFCRHCGESAAVDAGQASGADDLAGPDWPDAASAGSSALSQSERTTAVSCHLAAFVVPFGSIIAPLILWLMKRFDSSYIDHRGGEAVNFRTSLTIYRVVSGILILLIIGMPLPIALVVFSIAVTIIAAVRTSDGVEYGYPLSIRMLR